MLPVTSALIPVILHLVQRGSVYTQITQITMSKSRPRMASELFPAGGNLKGGLPNMQLDGF